MKTIKIILMSISLLFVVNGFSQKSNKKTFVRVYNLEGKKINKGYIHSVNNEILVLRRGNNLKIETEVKSIGKIKTKRSGGHNVLMGSAVGASLGAVLGVSTADPDAWIFGYSKGEGAIGFGTLGALGGAAVGGVAAGVKNTETFVINGQKENWKLFKERLSL